MNITSDLRGYRCPRLVSLRLALVLLTSSLWVGQVFARSPQAAAPSSPSSATEAANPQLLPIDAGDYIDVEIFNTPELSSKLRVDQLGQITLPLGGTIRVQGMTAALAASAIHDRLQSTHIMLDPSVTVSVLEYASEGVTVIGEVRSPGTYTLFGSHTLYDALAAAGGPTASEGSSITITHAGDADHPLIVKVTTPNYSAVQKATLINPGDTIMVSRAELVYVVGDVLRSGAFYMQSGQPLTILNVLSLAQGTNRTAAVAHASIVRPTPTGATTIPLNLNKVMKNQEPNLVLQAGDVLVIPRSGWKEFGYTALPGLTNAVANSTAAALINN